MQCAVGIVITEQRIPYNQIFPGFLLNFSFSRKTGPTSWHLPTLLPFFSLLPSPALLQHPAGQVLGPLKPLGVGAEGPAHSKLDQQTAASRSSPLTSEALVAPMRRVVWTSFWPFALRQPLVFFLCRLQSQKAGIRDLRLLSWIFSVSPWER